MMRGAVTKGSIALGSALLAEWAPAACMLSAQEHTSGMSEACIPGSDREFEQRKHSADLRNDRLTIYISA